MPVVLVGREAGSGTRDGFESIVDVKDACKYDQELTSTGAVIAGVAANPNAFGYASLSAVDDTVKAVTVEGVTGRFIYVMFLSFDSPQSNRSLTGF